MEKITDIKENLKVKEIFKKGRTIIFVIDDDKEILLSDIKTDDYFWNKWISDDNYIVAYSRGCMVNQIPLNIEAAYSIKNKKLLDLSNKKIKVLLEYMLIAKRGFDLANVLSEINNSDLELLNEDEKEDLSRFLTSGNKGIPHTDVINYILQFYPQLKKYTEELFKTKNTRPINQEYVYLNDNHFEYDNPTCSHCHKKHEKHKVIKKGFQTKKSQNNK